MGTNKEKVIIDLIKTVRANSISLLNAIKSKNEEQIKQLIEQLRKLERNIYKRVRKNKELSHQEKSKIYVLLAELQAIYKKEVSELKDRHLEKLSIFVGEEEQISEKLDELIKKRDYTESPIYIEICELAGVSPKTDWQDLGQRLLQMDQDDMGRWIKTYYSGPKSTSLYPIIKVIEKKYDEILTIPHLPEALLFLFLWYQHIVEGLIFRKKFNLAKRYINELFTLFSIHFESPDSENAPKILRAFLYNHLSEYEKLTKESWQLRDGFGWDGNVTYAHDLLYLMHARLKNVSYPEIDRNLKNGTIKLVTGKLTSSLLDQL